MKKTVFYLFVPILLLSIVCLLLCSCEEINNVSFTENSTLLKNEENVLILGDFNPKEEAFITYEEAYKRYDPFTASLGASIGSVNVSGSYGGVVLSGFISWDLN